MSISERRAHAEAQMRIATSRIGLCICSMRRLQQ